MATMKTYKIKLLRTFASKRSKRWASEVKIDFWSKTAQLMNELPTVQYPNAVKMVHKIDFRILIGKKYNQIVLKFTYRILIEVLGDSNGPYQQLEKRLSHYFSHLFLQLWNIWNLIIAFMPEKILYVR